MALELKPNQLMYSDEIRHRSIPANEMQGLFTPKNGNVFRYDKNRVVKFNLAGSGFLSCRESYCKFTIHNNSAEDIELSGTAGSHNCFDRYVTKLDNKIIDDFTTDYGHTMSVLSDFKMSRDHRDSFGAISGYASSSVKASNPLKNVVGDLRIATRYSYEDDTVVVPAGSTRVVCLPLQGLLSSAKYIPLHFLQSLEFELHLASVNKAYTSDNLVNDDEVEYSNFEYVADLIELDQQTIFELENVLKSPVGLTLSANTWKVSNFHVASNTGNYVYPIAEKWSSIKSILVSQRNADDIYGGSPLIDKNHRVYDGVTSVQLQVGSKYYPNQPLEISNSSSEPIVQVLKALGMSMHDYTTNSTVNLENFYLTENQIRFSAVAAPDAATYDASPDTFDAIPKQSGKFVMAFDMETYSENQKLLSGVNNAERNLTLTMHVKRQGGVLDNLLVTTMVLIDQEIIMKIDPTSGVLDISIQN